MAPSRLTGLVLAFWMASPVLAVADRVLLTNGASFEVRGFEITDGVLTVALRDRTWSVPPELVDLEGTRRANGMSPEDSRSPGWRRADRAVAHPSERESVEPVDIPGLLTAPEPEAASSMSPGEANLNAQLALAAVRAESEELLRALARETERLKQRVEELESSNAARHESLEGAEAESSSALAEAKAEYEEALAKVIAEYEATIRSMTRVQEDLERRVKELEIAQTAQEDATRAIIRDTTSTMGSKINQSVAFGGAFEVLAGRFNASSGRSESLVELATAEVDFEIQVNDWTLGSLILEWDGTNTFLQSIGTRSPGVDRITIDTAYLTIGNLQRFPLGGTFGRVILPFGISTGDPVADVLTLEDPLTIEAFEMRETGIQVDFAFPTPPLTPAPPPVAPPPVKPLAIQPLFKLIAKGLGYDPPPVRPVPPTPVTPPPAPPLFNVGLAVFQGTTVAVEAAEGGFNFGATAGLRKKWDCSRPYEELRESGWHRLACPWSIDLDVDYNSSVFDSRFLAFEYASFLPQIRTVPGMASSLKATLGALSFVGEWNAAIADATFLDDSGSLIAIRPSTWQVSLGYQFDWNPWVEAIGAQGNYVAFSYSVSEDLAGVTFSEERVGFLPWKRLSLSFGEWVMDGLRVAVEYSRNEDYPTSRGGTGTSSDAILSMVTYAW